MIEISAPAKEQMVIKALVEAKRIHNMNKRKGKKKLWSPEEGPQLTAFDHPADELFYGGQAGGGKTDLLLGLGICNHRKSIIFRREATQLREISARSVEIIGAAGRFNENLNVWRDLPGDRRIEFAGVKNEKDVNKWKGRPHDLYGFDEITEFTESQYRTLIAWNRSVIPGQPCRVVATGNPPTTIEGEWVIQHWAPWLDESHSDPAESGELRWFASIEGKDIEVESGDPFKHEGELILPKSRSFIPASLEDNPYLRETSYKKILQNLPEPLRSQLLYGDFSIRMEDDPWRVIPISWIEAAMVRWDEFAGDPGQRTALGVDPSRGGGDDCVLAPRHGTWFAPLLVYSGEDVDDGPKVAARVADEMENRYIEVNIDPIGIGSSPLDSLAANNIEVNPVNFGSRNPEATDRSGKYHFKNIRAEAHWGLREALDPDSGEELMLPRDRELKADLAAARWKLTVSGIQLEPKADIRERLGRSPSKGDAVLLAHWMEARTTGDWSDFDDLGTVEDFESRWE